MTMSETELSVICKNCGSEVSPYVTECPYCGARLRKRAPKLERRGDALEAQRRAAAAGRDSRAAARRRAARRRAPLRDAGRDPRLGRSCCSSRRRPATRSSAFGGLVVPFEDEWWRYLTAPFAYVDVGYLFVVAVGLAIFAHRARAAPRQRRRPALLLLACGSLGMLAASGDRQRPGRLHRDRRRQRDGARRASPPGSRSAAPRRTARSTRSTT